MLSSWIRRLFVILAALALAGCATGGVRQATTGDEADDRFAGVFKLMRGKEFAQAEQALLKLAEKTPDDALLLTNLGIVYAHMTRLDESVTALLRAIELYPKGAVAYNELGITYRRTGRFADAEQAYKNAIRVQPDYAKAHFNLAVLLDLYLQRQEQAIGHYQRFLVLESNEDKLVRAWVKDLQRRTGQGPSTAAADAEVEHR